MGMESGASMGGAGYGSAVLAIPQMATNIGLNSVASRRMKEIAAAKRKILLAQRNQQRFEDEQTRQDMNRQAYSTQQDIQSNANEAGTLHGSEAQVGLPEKVEAERARRMNALNHRAQTNEDIWDTEDSITALSKSLARLKQTQALINSIYQGGANGALEHYGSA